VVSGSLALAAHLSLDGPPKPSQDHPREGNCGRQNADKNRLFIHGALALMRCQGWLQGALKESVPEAVFQIPTASDVVVEKVGVGSGRRCLRSAAWRIDTSTPHPQGDNRRLQGPVSVLPGRGCQPRGAHHSASYPISSTASSTGSDCTCSCARGDGPVEQADAAVDV
jgi:hypothetical protein